MKPVEYLNDSQEVCQKCKSELAILRARSDNHCRQCFLRLVRGKQRKSMSHEKYKVNHKRKDTDSQLERVLLAFSGGISSLVLLDVLANLLVEQRSSHRGLQGFELVVVNLNEFELKSLNRKVAECLSDLVGLYPSVDLEVKLVSLESYADTSSFSSITVDQAFNTSSLNQVKNGQTSLVEIIRNCPNKSSSEDLLEIVKHQLILHTAAREECNTVVYGHSMTRLANEVLALTVKGRGSAVHRDIMNRAEACQGKEISIIYPFRDLLQVELEEYAKLSDLTRFEVKSTVATSKISKNMSVREILANYLAGLDDSGYLSSASTVVKIAEKLGAPAPQVADRCQVCETNIYKNPKEWLTTITVSEPAAFESEEEKEYLEEYLRTTKPANHNSSGSPIDLCYGCIVALNGVGNHSGFVWPIRPKVKLQYENHAQEKAAILDEYLLTDDEGNGDDTV